MPEIDTASIRRRMASGEIRNPTEVVFAVLAEVDRLRADVEYLARHESELAIKLTTANQKRYAAKAEVDRRRAENTALADALEDIAGITYSPAHEVYVNGECHRFQDPPCHEAEPTDPEDWCVTCVAEVAWSAWKMGVLGG